MLCAMGGKGSSGEVGAEAGWVDGLLRGDEAAFQAFFDAYLPRVYALAAARLDSLEAAERATRECLAGVIDSLPTLPPEVSLPQWVFAHALSAVGRNRSGEDALSLGVGAQGPVGTGGHPDPAAEDGVEVTEGLPAGGEPDLGHAERLVPQQLLGALDAE